MKIHHNTMPNRVYTIALDFDGTLVESDYPRIGALKTDVVEKLLSHHRELVEAGYRPSYILNTCRENDELAAALLFCDKNLPSEIRVIAANYNPNQTFKSRKPCASEYWDDRAVNPLNDPDNTAFWEGESEECCSHCKSRSRWFYDQYCPVCGRKMTNSREKVNSDEHP